MRVGKWSFFDLLVLLHNIASLSQEGRTGGASAPLPPVFGRSVNPISTGGHIIPTQYYKPPPDFQTFRRPCIIVLLMLRIKVDGNTFLFDKIYSMIFNMSFLFFRELQEAAWSLLFLNNNDPVICTLLFSGPYFGLDLFLSSRPFDLIN